MSSASTAPSTRQRLLSRLIVWVLLLAAAVTLAVWRAARHEINELFDETLSHAATLMAPAFNSQALPDWPELSPQTLSEQTFAWQVVDAQGVVIKRSSNAPEPAFHATDTPGYSGSSAWRIFGLALGQHNRMLYVAQTSAERSEALASVVLGALLTAAAIGLLGYGWLRAGLVQELQPIERLSRQLRDFEPETSSLLLQDAERRELQPMHDAIHKVSERLALHLHKERSLAAHAAHALRTPLAGMEAQLAVALAESEGSTRERLQRVRDATGRLQRVVTALIALFRTGQEAQRRRVDVCDLAEEIPVPNVKVTVVGQGVLDADPDLLAAALANLLDNAQRHGAHEVRLECPNERCLQVSDDGPGLPPERLQALQQALNEQAYERLSGMGLMLADRVARAHQGSLELRAGQPGFGAILRLGHASVITSG